MEAEQISALHRQIDREQGDVFRFANQEPTGTPSPLCLHESSTTEITKTPADHHRVGVDAPGDPLRCCDVILLTIEGHPSKDMNTDRQSAVYAHSRFPLRLTQRAHRHASSDTET